MDVVISLGEFEAADEVIDGAGACAEESGLFGICDHAGDVDHGDLVLAGVFVGEDCGFAQADV